MKIKPKKIFLIGLIGFLLLLSVRVMVKTALGAPTITTDTKEVTVTGKVTNETDAAACLEVLKENLTAANDKNIEAYLNTLTKDGRKDTKKEMLKFFETYDVKHTLLSFEVVKQEKNSMLIATQQQALNQGKSDFRNHVSQVHLTFVKEKDHWFIQESYITDTKFLD